MSSVPRVGIKPSSCKNKGRRFQQEIERALKNTFDHLKGNDIRSVSMGCAGADLILSTAALQVLPYDFEMKNQENLQLWAALRQCTKRVDAATEIYPLLVIRKNRTKPLAILPLGHYCYLRTGRSPVHLVDQMCSAQQTLEHFGIDVSLDPEVNLANAAQAVVAASHGQPYNYVVKRNQLRQVTTGTLALLHGKKTLNIWSTHDGTTPLIFNRGDNAMPMYIAIRFEDFLALVKNEG
jgi:hypothetical protein